MLGKIRKKWQKLPEVTITRHKIDKHVRKIEGATIKHAHRFLIKRWSNVVEVRRHVVTWIAIMALLVAATGLQLMWCQQNYRTEAAANNGTYAEAVLGPIDTLNPLFADSSAEKSAGYLLFSRMLDYDTTGNLNYDLATNIKVNKTETIYTVSIRDDVKWHDGEDLTANDIVFTVGLIQDEDTRSKIAGWDDVSVKIIDDYKVEFTLQTAYAAFEHALNFAILPQHILGDVDPVNIRENSFSQNPIGSGSFKLSYVQNVDYESGEKIIYMARNSNYYNGKAKLASFQLHVYGTRDEIIEAIANSEVNAATDITPFDESRINLAKYEIVNQPIRSGMYAILNTKSSILGDVNVRRALQKATNISSILEELPDGTPELYLPFTGDQLTGNLPSMVKYDLDGAISLLEKKGWKLNSDGIREKDGKELELSVVAVKGSESETILKILAGQWRSLGVLVETQIVNPDDISQNVAQSILQPRNYDVLLYRLDIGGDPDMYAYWHSSQISDEGMNLANYSSVVSDDILVSARISSDDSLRNAKYIAFAKQWLNDVPAIGLYQTTMQYVKSKKVNTFNVGNKLISSVDRYTDVLNWSTGTEVVYKTP